MKFIYRCLGCGARIAVSSPIGTGTRLNARDFIEDCMCPRDSAEAHFLEIVEPLKLSDLSIFNRRGTP